MPDVERLTYRQLGERLGMTPDSARSKARRLKWVIEPGNHPADPVHVLVPLAFLASYVSAPRALPGGAPVLARPEALSLAQGRIAELERSLTIARAESEQWRAMAEAWQRELDKARAEHQATAERWERTHMRTIAGLRKRIFKAERSHG